MTDAALERIEPDAFLAADLLGRAEVFARDGRSSALGPESRLILLHNAVICACDAVLAIDGRRVVGSVGGHQLRIAEVARRLPSADTELFTALDDARVLRNAVSDAAGMAPVEGIEDTAAAVQRLLELVDAKVSPALPDWLRGADGA